MEKKFELTDETIVVLGKTYYKIKALKDIEGTSIKKGDFGGFVEKEENLSHEGSCWIYGNARVYGDAIISENSQIYGNAEVFGNAKVYGDARIFGYARVGGDAHVCGNVSIYDHVWLTSNAHVKSSDDVCYYLANFEINDIHGTTFFKCADGTIKVRWSKGCATSTLDKFRDHVRKKYGDSKTCKEYLLVADLAEFKFSESDEQKKE